MTTTLTRTLARDIARCGGRYDFEPDGAWCEQRHSCQRFLAFTQWDREVGLTCYRDVPVFMAQQPCEVRIPVAEVADD